MAQTNHSHAADPVEGDGISYSGIVWFVVVLVVTALFCEVFVWGMFKFALVPYRVPQSEVAPLAAEPAKPTLEGGRIVTGLETPPQPSLLVTEPTVLKAFRDDETKQLHEYGWINQGAQTVRLPIDRAKTLLLERGLPVRPAPAASTAAPAPAAPAAAAK
jgi:hypothetical protein